MRQLFALSAIGRDRPGIVADLAELIYECDCNLEDSRMTILGSEFAVLLLLSGQGADVERRLSTGCKRLEWEKRLTVFFRPLDGDAAGARRAAARRVLECGVTGVDKAGIVARIARTHRRSGRQHRRTCAPSSAPSPSRGRRSTRCGSRCAAARASTSARCASGSSATRPSSASTDAVGEPATRYQAIGDGARSPRRLKSAGGVSGAARQVSVERGRARRRGSARR